MLHLGDMGEKGEGGYTVFTIQMILYPAKNNHININPDLHILTGTINLYHPAY
jgi:hypothetical protein